MSRALTRGTSRRREMELADIREHEQVHVLDIDNGARFETYEGVRPNTILKQFPPAGYPYDEYQSVPHTITPNPTGNRNQGSSMRTCVAVAPPR